MLKLAFLPCFTTFRKTIYEFPVIKGAKSSFLADQGRSLAKIKEAALLGQRFLEINLKMVDEDSNSTDLIVSGEEGHSTILLAYCIFRFCIEDKLI